MNGASLEERWNTLVREALNRRILLVGLFACVSLGFTLIGLAWPSKYQSYATILVESKDILGPLMEGAAVPTEARDRGRMAQDLIFSRSVMRDILEVGGWLQQGEAPHSGALQRLVGVIDGTFGYVGSPSNEDKTTDGGGADANPTPTAEATVPKWGYVLADFSKQLANVIGRVGEHFGFGKPEDAAVGTSLPPADLASATDSNPDKGTAGRLTLADQEQLMDEIKRRTLVSTYGENLVRVTYWDSDPHRAQRVANLYAKSFVVKSSELKLDESTAAFEFIEAQAEQYREKLITAETKLKEWRSEHLDARLGTDAEISARIATIRNSLEGTRLELKEAEIRTDTLAQQLSGEVTSGSPLTKADHFRVRIAELQGELDTLRLSYRDTYPDIIRLNSQIADLRLRADREESRRMVARQDAQARGEVFVDETMAFNPLYHELRRQLAQSRTNIAILKARIIEKEANLRDELDRGRRVHTGEAVQADLVRDYEVNRDIYNDLLRRRENARVSKQLDSNQEGPTARVYEEAFLPHRPVGLWFMHFLIAGLLLGIGLPTGVLLAIQQFDPRIRSPEALVRGLKVPLIAVVPHMFSPRERGWWRLNTTLLFLVIIATLSLIAAMSMVRIQGIA